MRTQASTLSVLLEGSKSIHMWVKVGKETCNVSVRFDQGDAATICGYPQQWILHDYHIEEFNSDSMLGKEYVEDIGYELEPGQVYIDEAIEIKILEAAIRGIRKQAKDPMFKDHATKEFRLKCIEACKRKIKALEEVSNEVA